ncbi:MAG: DUF4838 domain-containing protein [Armatimonadetes bacterium]|nr:DUF4838 domain-containing protein [Armatimonadota bacterium]
MRRIATAVTVVLAISCAWAEGPAELGRIDFNFPPPPAEGQADYLTIARDGEATACIVVPAKAALDERRAARALEIYLEAVTGGSFSIITDDQDGPALPGRIHVGDTAVAREVPLDLPPVRYGDIELPNINGYMVATVNPNTLIIRGANPKATLLGAMGFLRRYVGVRRYWPGDPGGIGDVVPQRPTLTVPEVRWRDWPYFISRIMSGLDDRGPRTEAGRWHTFAEFWRMNYTIPSNESYYKLLDAVNRRDEPDIFPLIDGKRYIPGVDERGRIRHGWQPCVSNPRVARIMADTLIGIFEKEPDRIAMNLAVNDGLGDCTCEGCRAMDPPGADIINRIGLCDRYVKFDNRVAEMVAERFPDRILAFIAYGSMREPPTTVQLHPMLMPVLCSWANTFEMWDKWMATGAQHMGLYLYHDDIRFIMPKLDVRQSAKRIRYIVASGRARSFYQEFYGIYPLDGMVGYVENELCWDPRLDVDAILDEFYTGFYRAAAEPMRGFYDELEAGYESWLAENGYPHPFGMDASSITDSRSLEQFRVLPVERAEAAEAYLDAALAAAAGDEPVTERIGLVKSLFDFCVPGARMYWAMDRLRGRQVESVDDARLTVADAREAINNGLALAAYKFAVMEHPPASEYARHTSTATVYNDLAEGAAPSEVLSIVGRAFRNAGKLLGREMGPDGAAAWWDTAVTADDPELLRKLVAVGRFESMGGELENLVADPSFEARGARNQPAGGERLPPEVELQDGVAVWHSAGTAVHGTLTRSDAHTGEWSFTFTGTRRAGVSHSTAAGPGEVMLMSVWVKHNAGEASYRVTIIPRGDRMLSRASVEVPEEPDVWHQVELVFITPPETRTVGLYLFTERQTPGAQVWVDDFFMARYPEEK